MEEEGLRLLDRVEGCVGVEMEVLLLLPLLLS